MSVPMWQSGFHGTESPSLVQPVVLAASWMDEPEGHRESSWTPMRAVPEKRYEIARVTPTLWLR